MTLSRRSFLQAAGVTLASPMLDHFAPLVALADDAPVKGRVLEAVHVGGNFLWPDAVVTIVRADSQRYRLREGWVARQAIQPMFLDAPDEPTLNVPDYIEVHAPVAPVYSHATLTGPPLLRVGHGSVLTVREALRDIGNAVAWFGVETASGGLGWVQGERVRPASEDISARSLPAVDHLHLDCTRQHLTLFSAGEALMTTPVSTGTAITIATGVTSMQKSAPHALRPDAALQGMSWVFDFGNSVAAGVNAHNRFGTPQPGPDVQLPLPVARLLYASLAEDASIEVG